MNSVGCLNALLRHMNVLTLTTVYPNSAEPSLGIFVEKRLRYLAAHASVKVISPVPVINYADRRRTSIRIPHSRWDRTIEVVAPRWLYPPVAGALNAIFLFLQVRPPIDRLQREFPFQIIDAHFAHPEGVAAALLARIFGCPFTITLRGSEQLHQKHWLRRIAMGWALRRASRVLPVSQRLAELAVALGADPARVAVIPNGVETETFHLRDRAACRAEYGLSPETKAIVSAGHLIELKGHHRIMQALSGLLREGLPVELLIAGGRGRGGDYEAELRRQMSDLKLNGRVRFLGHLSQEALARLFNAADVFCLASSREGWPNVLQEAMACGAPAVAADVGAVPDMIASDRYGFVVPSDNPAALQDALEKALRQSWDRNCIAAWGQARSWDQVAREVLQELSKSCEEFSQGV